mmetsp:Transcript_8372/g.26180  ORF Transcript_8372/g.26180 Transcript_8372/m.26180 type:complete len:107 (-) Transcript_8372:1763-2083(-)
MRGYEDDFEDFEDSGDDNTPSLSHDLSSSRGALNSSSSKQAKYGLTKLVKPMGSTISWNPLIGRARKLRSELVLKSERQVVLNQPSLTEHQMYWIQMRGSAPRARE